MISIMMKNPKITVGILALHGDVSEHQAILDDLQVDHIEVRTSHDLKDVTHLIIPGGESTVISKMLFLSDLGETIQKRVKEGSLAVMGTCAGAILMAEKVKGDSPPRPLKLIPITIDRNAYGSQLHSFDTDLSVKGRKGSIHVSFIRAPIILETGKNVEILASHEKYPVIVQSGRLLAMTCHPEVQKETAIHTLFLSL